MCVFVCMGVEQRKKSELRGGWSASLVRPASKYPCISIPAVSIFVLLTYITSSKSSVWCVGYYYPTNYRVKLILKIQ